MKTGRSAQSPLAEAILKNLVSLLLLLIVTTMLVQFVILSTVGTIGPEVSRLSREIEETELQNEVTLAEIRHLQTNKTISEAVANNFEMQFTDIKVVDNLSLDEREELAQAHE